MLYYRLFLDSSDDEALSEGGRLDPQQLYILDPNEVGGTGLTILPRQRLGTGQGNELTRNSSRNARPQSSQLAEPLWTDPGIKSGISVHELISTSKAKQKKRRWEVNG